MLLQTARFSGLWCACNAICWIFTWGNFQFTSQLVLAKPLRPFGTSKLFLQQPEGMCFCFWPHSPVLVPGMRKSSDEDELDEDEGKPSHHAHIMPSCKGGGRGEVHKVWLVFRLSIVSCSHRGQVAFTTWFTVQQHREACFQSRSPLPPSRPQRKVQEQ